MRKFEFVSEEQWLKDCREYPDHLVSLPKRGTKLSAGYDIFAPYGFILKPGDEITHPTGVKAYMNKNEFLMIVPRSGMGFKYYIRLANTCGIIDSDYVDNENNEGHIWVKIRNEGDKVLVVKQGDAICQAIFVPFFLTDDDNLDDGKERIGGFGSTVNRG